MTNEEFAARTANMTKECADWTASILEHADLSKEAKREQVALFLRDMRRALELIEMEMDGKI